MNKEIVHLLGEGFSLVTPTMRLSAYLKNQFAALQIASGKRTWESADILPWQAWLTRFWDDFSAVGDEVPLRLNVSQQANVWLKVVQESDVAEQILQTSSVAKRALQAWALSHQWQIPLYPEDVYISRDVRAFQSWSHAYQGICKKKLWLDDACLPDILIARLSKASSRIDIKIALFGFDEIQPQQKSLLRALTAAGGEVRRVSQAQRNRDLKVSGFIDERDEINATANWIKNLLQTNEAESIGIVVPNLPNVREKIQDQFDDVLLPGGILESSEPRGRPYSVSLGQGLNTYPMIAAAFSILELMDQAIVIQQAGSLLRSPFIKGGQTEQSRRALLDACLREYGEQTVSPNTLSFVAQKQIDEEYRSVVFLECLAKWQSTFQELPNSQSAHSWAVSFSQLLTTFNWPGDRPLNSTEFQTLSAWQDLLTQFVSLDVVNSDLNYRAALTQLSQLASSFSFQPETEEVPVQVMGYTGAAGMHFDHLWLMGLHEEAWPPISEPNPFIPLALQVQHKLPNASAKNRLAYTKNITTYLLNSSPDVVISYPRNDRERPLRPSPLIRSFQKGSDVLQITTLSLYRSLIFQDRQFEYLKDDKGPIIPGGQRVSGGTGLFKDQAACAFRAFAKHRLGARGLVEPDIGLDAMDRGLLLHDVMQFLWGKISGHRALMLLSAEEQKSLIAGQVDLVLDSFSKQHPQTFSARFTALEKQRLVNVTEEWLEIEKQRKAFHVIAREKKHVFTFSGIQVHSRIDRIDKIDDGRLVIIDYKTGNISLGVWFDERPEDPQLPLYAITSEGELAAIAFAKVKRGESRFIGIANEEGILPAIKPFAQTRPGAETGSWQEQMDNWELILLQVGDDFRQGEAAVNPKNAMTCRYCDLHAFCRIHEHVVTMNDAVDEGEGNE